MILLDMITIILICAGIAFFALGVLGVLRFPDFFSRMHAAGKCDALAAVLIIVGFAIYNLQELSFGHVLTSLKILFIAAFTFIASPTATHALVKTALVLGAEPWSKAEWLKRGQKS